MMRYNPTLRKPANSTNPPSVLVDEFPALDLLRIFWLSAVSSLLWTIIASSDTLGRWLGIGFIGIMVVTCLSLLIRGKIIESLSMVVYLAMLEPALRTFIKQLPYLALAYFFVFWVLVALDRHNRSQRLDKSPTSRLRAPAVFYLMYLGLEVLGVFNAVRFENARSVLLSSATLGFSLLLVNKIHLQKADLNRLFTAILVGVANLITIIALGYATSTINWGRQSSSAASGGMGPVQISMLLALGIVILLVMADRVNFIRRVIYSGLAAIAILVMVLTFSRNGLYLTVLALVIYYFLFSKFSWRTITILILLSVLGTYLFNSAMNIAGSAFTERYADLNTTNRNLLVAYGWRIFLDNPILGVGTSNYYDVVARAEYFGTATGAHNEIIRAAAEHGILGLFTWTCFAISTIWVGFEAQGKTRALRMALLGMFFAYLAVNGLKLLIQPLILLMALIADKFE